MSVAIVVVSTDFILLILVLREHKIFLPYVESLKNGACYRSEQLHGLFIELLPCIIYILDILPFFSFKLECFYYFIAFEI